MKPGTGPRVQRLFSRLNPGASLLLVYASLVGMIALRMIEVDRKIGSYIACPGCFHAVVVANDLALIALVTGMLLLASFFRGAWPARFIQALAGVPILLYLTDLLLFRLFHARLFMSDAALFIRERTAVWDQFQSGMGGSPAAAALLVVVSAWFLALFWMRPLRSRRARLTLSTLLLFTLAGGGLAGNAPYVNSWAVDNVFAANLATGSKIRYSAEYAAAVMSSRPPEVTIADGRHGGATPPRNVVVVLLESWSSWHSALFGGCEDWTPELDRAAERGLRFENFHAIGFATDRGLMGILAGEPLWAPFIHWYQASPFHSIWGVERTLPATFGAAGYHTAFLTTGPLELYQKGEWLVDLGFAQVEGQEHPFYADWPRFSFNSASDRALYQRAEQWRSAADEPYLLVLETVTTHQPYEDPESGARSLEQAMKYADREFGAYLDRLDDSGFFEDGLLLVVSDHRSMTPISAQELERFGLQAYSRVPAFVIGRGFIPGRADSTVYSQSDIVPSFDAWLGGSAGLEAADSLMLTPDRPAPAAISADTDCALHSRGNERGLVNVICAHGEGVVQLGGDATRFIEATGLGAGQQARLLDQIARIRLDGLARHRQAQEESE